MENLTIIVSGPGGFEAQARKALAEAGLAVHDKCVDHGLPQTASGETDASHGFVSCEGNDLDVAVRAVGSLHWVLRAHYPPPKIMAPLLADAEAAHEERIRQIVRDEMARA